MVKHFSTWTTVCMHMLVRPKVLKAFAELLFKMQLLKKNPKQIKKSHCRVWANHKARALEPGGHTRPTFQKVLIYIPPLFLPASPIQVFWWVPNLKIELPVPDGPPLFKLNWKFRCHCLLLAVGSMALTPVGFPGWFLAPCWRCGREAWRGWSQHVGPAPPDSGPFPGLRHCLATPVSSPTCCLSSPSARTKFPLHPLWLLSTKYKGCVMGHLGSGVTRVQGSLRVMIRVSGHGQVQGSFLIWN